MEMGVSCSLCSEHPHGTPSFALSRAWVCRAARAGRAGQRKEHSSRVPTGPGGRRQLLAPPRCSPSWQRSWQGMAPCWHRWSLDVAWARPVFEPGFLARAGGASWSAWVPRALMLGLGHVAASCLIPADRRHLQRTAVAALAQKVTCLLVTQPGAWGALA